MEAHAGWCRATVFVVEVLNLFSSFRFRLVRDRRSLRAASAASIPSGSYTKGTVSDLELSETPCAHDYMSKNCTHPCCQDLNFVKVCKLQRIEQAVGACCFLTTTEPCKVCAARFVANRNRGRWHFIPV